MLLAPSPSPEVTTGGLSHYHLQHEPVRPLEVSPRLEGSVAAAHGSTRRHQPQERVAQTQRAPREPSAGVRHLHDVLGGEEEDHDVAVMTDQQRVSTFDLSGIHVSDDGKVSEVTAFAVSSAFQQALTWHRTNVDSSTQSQTHTPRSSTYAHTCSVHCVVFAPAGGCRRGVRVVGLLAKGATKLTADHLNPSEVLGGSSTRTRGIPRHGSGQCPRTTQQKNTPGAAAAAAEGGRGG